MAQRTQTPQLAQYICLGIILNNSQTISNPYFLLKQAARPADLVGNNSAKHSYFYGPIATRRVASTFLQRSLEQVLPSIGPGEGTREGFIVRRSVIEESRRYFITDDGTVHDDHTANPFDYVLKDLTVYIMPWPPLPLSYFYHGTHQVKVFFRYQAPNQAVIMTINGTARSTDSISSTQHKLIAIEDSDYSVDLMTLITERETSRVKVNTEENRT